MSQIAQALTGEDVTRNQRKQLNKLASASLAGETIALPAFSKGGGKGDRGRSAGGGGNAANRAASVPLPEEFKSKFLTKEALDAKSTPPTERTDRQRSLLPCRFHIFGAKCQQAPIANIAISRK